MGWQRWVFLGLMALPMLYVAGSIAGADNRP